MKKDVLEERPGIRPATPAAGWRRCIGIVALLLLSFFLAMAADDAIAATLAERLTPEIQKAIFPNAERLGPEDGKPLAIAAYKGSDLIGYIFSTLDVVAAPGYYGIPFDVLVGVTVDGVVTGAKVIAHHEPYIMNNESRQAKLDTFLARHAETNIQGSNVRMLPPDFVAGATVSARAMRAAIYDAARIVLRSRMPRRSVTVPTLDVEGFAIKSWQELIDQGSVTRVRVTNREAAAMLEKAGGPGVKPEVDFGPNPDDTYIEIFIALATPQSIGRNLVGGPSFATYMAPLTRGTQVIAVASNGPYDFFGLRYYRNGQTFDRIRLIQGDLTKEFKREEFIRLGSRGATPDIHAQHYAALYTIAPDIAFDPLEPWRLEVSIYGTGANDKKVAASFFVPYKLPAVHILMPDVEPTPAWIEAWQESRDNVTILAAALVVLTLILAFQSWLTRYRSIHRWVRNGFLAFVVVWLGWIAGGQLSIVNVTNYLQAPFRGFDVTFYLAEPIMVMVAAYTALSLLLLGRGVFCGWLCPFGALQELLGQLSRALRLPQWNPSERLQRRLWLVKYVAAALVLGLSFVDFDLSTEAAEIEPFKTAITSHFTRAWPFIVYAVALLGIGLFTERAYCRFLCPLGGTLAALDRLHLIDLLRRRPECGSPCHLCESSCPVKAIERSGKIQMAECFQCLDCQVEYYDDKRCPPLAKIRKRAARGQAVPLGVPAAAE